MTSATFLQAFLLVNVFIIGALSAVAVRHAYAHFRPPAPEPEKQHVTKQSVHLPPEVRERLLEAAQANFQKVLDRSADELQHDLGATTTLLNNHLEKLGTEIVGSEMDRYQTELDQLRQQAETSMTGASAEIIEHQTELKAKLAEEIAAEKARLVQQIDSRLADAVASFLIETLQHNVDLGAQSTYLTAMLEEHKADFVRGVADEASATR